MDKVKFIVLILFLSILTFSSGAWWNSNWDYRTEAEVIENSNNDLTNFQVSFEFDTKKLISEDKMESDCSDMRWIDSDDSTELDYWIESGCGTSNTKVWVKLPELSAGSTRTIYMYHGNTAVHSNSDPHATMAFFENFSSGDLDNWDKEGNTRSSGGSYDHSIDSEDYYTPGYSAEVYTDANCASAPYDGTVAWLEKALDLGQSEYVADYHSSVRGGQYSYCQSDTGGMTVEGGRIYRNNDEIATGASCTYNSACEQCESDWERTTEPFQGGNFNLKLYNEASDCKEKRVNWDQIVIRKYADPQPTTEMSSDSTSNTVNAPKNPDPSDGAIVSTDSIGISAEYSNPGGEDGKLTYYDGSGTEIGSCPVNDGERCSVTWNDYSHGENDWHAVAESGDTTNQSETWTLIKNNPPDSVSSPDNPQDGETIYGDSVNLNVTVSDPDGDEMSVEFLNNVSNSSQSERTDSANDGEQASVTQDLDRGETYKWWVNVSDDWNSTNSDSWSFYVNSEPGLLGVEPSDGSLLRKDTVTLNVTVDDEDSSQVFAYFFERDGDFLGKDSSPSGGKLSSDEWTGLELGETYNWFVNLSDGNENKTYGDFEFLRASQSSYRILIRVDQKYSSLISSIGSTKLTRVELENQISEEKSINIYLEDVNAYFQENSKSEIGYTLGPSETKEFVIVVEPESEGQKELSVIVEEIGIGLNTTEKIPVTVRDVPEVSDSREIPGIGALQIIMLVMLAGFLYSARL